MPPNRALRESYIGFATEEGTTAESVVLGTIMNDVNVFT
jgi:hypothetical protein